MSTGHIDVGAWIREKLPGDKDRPALSLPVQAILWREYMAARWGQRLHVVPVAVANQTERAA